MSEVRIIGQRFYEVECKLDMKGVVVFVVSAESAEEATAIIERHRDYPLSLDWKIIGGESEQIYEAYVTEIGEPYTSVAVRRTPAVQFPGKDDPSTGGSQGGQS